MEGWKGYTECHREGGVLSCHFRHACLPYSPCSCCLPQCQRPGRPHVTHAARPFSSAWVNRDRAQGLRSVGRSGLVPLMARQLLAVIRQGRCSVCLLFPPARTPLIGFSRLPKSKQTSLQDKHSPPAAVLGTDAPSLQVYCSARFTERGHQDSLCYGNSVTRIQCGAPAPAMGS